MLTRTRSRALLTVVAVLVSLVSVFPVLWMLTSSFKTRDTVNDGKLIPEDFTFDNFVYVFAEVPFARYLWNSFFISTVITLVALLLHSMAAYALARLRFPGRETIFM